MSKVYLVSSGCYSDYHVDAVFSSEEAATAYMRAFPKGDDWNDIEPMEIDPLLPAEAKAGLVHYRVWIRRNGDVKGVEGAAVDAWESGDFYAQRDWASGRGFFDLPREMDVVSFVLWARDKDHAIKIANERRIALLASEAMGSVIEAAKGER